MKYLYVDLICFLSNSFLHISATLKHKDQSLAMLASSFKVQCLNIKDLNEGSHWA